MSYRSETPFDNIENSHKYVAMLAEAIAEAQADVDSQMELAISEKAERRQEALQLVSYHLVKLNTHIANSRRVLNDCAACGACFWKNGACPTRRARNRPASTPELVLRLCPPAFPVSSHNRLFKGPLAHRN